MVPRPLKNVNPGIRPNLIISTDHKPLLGILKDRELSSISNIKLQSLKELTFSWQFKIVYNPGKWHRGADAMSRNPSGGNSIFHILQTIASVPIGYDLNNTIDNSFQAITTAKLDAVARNVVSMQDLQTHAQSDDTYQN